MADFTREEILAKIVAGETLEGANLSGPNPFCVDVLEPPNDRRLAYLRKANLEGAQYDKATKWPDDFEPEAAGAVLVEEGFDPEAAGAVVSSHYVESVANAITKKLGYKVDLYVKSGGLTVSGIIHIGIIEPRNPGTYILGIMCDGGGEDCFHPNRRANLENKRLTHKLLEQVGWRIYRIWRMDWYKDPTHEIEKLKAELMAIENDATFVVR